MGCWVLGEVWLNQSTENHETMHEWLKHGPSTDGDWAGLDLMTEQSVVQLLAGDLQKLLVYQIFTKYPLTDGINFVHKDNAWLVISSITKHLTNKAGTLPDIFVNNGTRHHLKEGAVEACYKMLNFPTEIENANYEIYFHVSWNKFSPKKINSLPLEDLTSLKLVKFKLISTINIVSIFCETAIRWMPRHLTDH